MSGGLVRGACLTGAWSLSQEERDATVTRLADVLLSCSFHWRKELLGDPLSRAKSCEARAYATAQVACVTTTGERPHVEGLRVYTREAAKLAQALLKDALATGSAAAAAACDGGVSTSFSLVSNDREFLTAERAEELLAPLFAPGARFSKARIRAASRLRRADAGRR
jgi:large subunit ribosomal protein L31/Ran GTPase-activating protein 1